MIDRELDTVLDGWLAEGPTVAPDRVIGAALAEVPLTRQARRLPAPLEDILMRMQPFAPIAAAAAVGAIALLLLYTALGSPSDVGEDAPSATASPTPTAHRTEEFVIDLTMQLPAGWEFREAPAFASAFRPAPQPEQLFERIVIADAAQMTVSEPSGAQPWPDDLFAWLSEQSEFEPSQPESTSLAGFPATIIDAASDYDATASQPTRRVAQIGPQEAGAGLLLALVDGPVTWRFIEVDLGEAGTIVITYLHPTASFDAFAVEVQTILEQLEIN